MKIVDLQKKHSISQLGNSHMGSRTGNVPHTSGSRCFESCSQCRVKTPGIVHYAESPRYFFAKKSISYLLWGVKNLPIVYYEELKLPISFTTGSHCYLQGVDHENLKDSPAPERDSVAKTHLWICGTSQEDKFE